MILSDFDLAAAIKGKRLLIEPFSDDIVRENGVDLRIDNEVARHVTYAKNFVMDPSNAENIAKSYRIQKSLEEIILDSREQVLLTTYERIAVPDDLMGFVELRSTWARHGLSMPPTIIDAGFSGNVTLEVINNSPYKIKLRPKQRFAHIIFAKTTSRVSNVYTGLYKDQKGVKLPKVLKP